MGEEEHVPRHARARRTNDVAYGHLVSRVVGGLKQLGVERDGLDRVRVGLGERTREAGLVRGDRVVLLVLELGWYRLVWRM